ncbi:16S rRNA (uracil(1498)-N(3))-methyltransferase [Polynucleobacter sp. Latsch14-2]|jgi:16S rRNA (uracil1498-N3)-methyltransferase|uniref:16S rRNA (uracil(1498)-N(3))-methyltransferase n=1 Tax=Polynucleobacter sp. Latsch14-2 TaxID=2576920 RepID=UPI001C0CEE46|nr:16S rRNA (uracil(1498)-N(3))-methyltransferase [Polynucleobacter sp. Latsch14-2]MBU3613774.1 16S rRNA (uracil(1498)-N(3))-methyltransferase [Polynucleobacter sp. Latsch14-2]
MPQFYLPGPWEIQKPTPLTPEVAHHLRVRRVQLGASFPVFDGKGQVAKAELLSLSTKSGEALITEARFDTHRETPYAITLAQGLAGGDKMDWIIEKAIETGAQKIAPLQCERSVIKLTGSNNAERAEKRGIHWKGIIQAACEQCDRTVLAKLESIQSFESYLKTSEMPSLKLLLSPDATTSMNSILINTAPQDIVLMIGPEGGHSPEEESLARAAGYQLVSLGERVLRTETAGVVAITAVHTIWGSEMQNRLK